MKTICYLSVGLCMLFCVEGRCHAAITGTTTRGEFPADLNGLLSSSDLLHGLIATEMPGDLGWHPANPAAANSLHPDGLPAFTDGSGHLSTLTGLLNDFPGEGLPTKLLEYDLGGAFDIDRIGILTGNANNSDGRIFSTFVIRVSTDNGVNFSPLGGLVPDFDPNNGLIPNSNGYYQSNASGWINNESGIPGTTEDAANFAEIFDDGVAPIATGVTHIQFDFYAVDNTLGEMRDPWGDPNDLDPNSLFTPGPNPFTGSDDGLTRPVASPLVWEIDVIGQPASAADDADFDGSNEVNGEDMLIWQRGFGLAGQTDNSNGDADLSGTVDNVDLGIWETQYGGPPPIGSLAAVPEPTSVVLTAIALAFAAATRRRRV